MSTCPTHGGARPCAGCARWLLLVVDGVQQAVDLNGLPMTAKKELLAKRGAQITAAQLAELLAIIARKVTPR